MLNASIARARNALRLHPLAACVLSALFVQAGGSGAAGNPLPRATLVVQNCNDSGAGSLRAVVGAAVDGDVINMTGLTCGTITLTSGAITLTPTAGSLTLNGPGAAALSISGNDTSRVFEQGFPGTLTLSSITLTHGAAPDNGGCLYATSNVVLNGVNVVDCAAGGATAGAANGGGAFVANAILDGTTFANNTVDGTLRVRGGGIAVTGMLSASNSSFTGNHATSHNAGGASANQAIAEGGGIAALGATDLTDSVISGNTAESESAPAYGGGVAVGSHPDDIYGSLDLLRGMVTGNSVTSQCGVCAPQGGGITVEGEARLRNTQLNGNSSGSLGLYGGAGGMRVFSGNNEIDASTISGNHADSAGGGLFQGYGYLTIDGTTISGNDAGNQGGTNEGGGGINCLACALILTSSTVSDNVAGSIGGGIAARYIDSGPAAAVIQNSTISGNTGSEGGGLMLDGSAVIANSTIAFNAASTRGAGISATDYSYQIQLQSTIVSSNTSGGAVANVWAFPDTVSGANNLVPGSSGMPDDTITADPLLLPLADNGGPTRTHALGDASPAIDAGNDAAGLVFDQRGDGFLREAGAFADIGSFEVQGASPATYAIGGNVSGLAGSGLVLQQNGSDDLPITTNGSFTFATPAQDGSHYAVTVSVQPSEPIQTCIVKNGSGTVTGAEVTDIEVVCTTAPPSTYHIGGHVNGLVGSGLVLQQSGGDDLAVLTNGSFTFSEPVQDGSDYSVSVLTDPVGPQQSCVVSNASGEVAGADITDVEVNCSNDTTDRIFADGFDGG